MATTTYMTEQEAMAHLGLTDNREFLVRLSSHMRHYTHPRRTNYHVSKQRQILYGDAVRSLGECHECMTKEIVRWWGDE